MNQKCIYCGKIADTKDHVPPKCFFLKPAPSNLITVPSCFACNNSFSQDEEYARTVFATARQDDAPNHVVEKLWNEKIVKSLRRNPLVLENLNKCLFSVEGYHGPIYVGTRPGFTYDRNKVNKVVSKII
jgi:hypothetical protein